MTRKILFGLLIFVVALGVLEAAGRLVETALPAGETGWGATPGWQAEFFRTFLDWHEPDSFLLWRFKAGLNNPLVKTNSQHLLGDEIAEDKPPGTFRIILLGDSSPVGLGLKSRLQAFGEQLQRYLNVSLVNFDRVELVNAAVSGYTSEQIRRFLEREGWRYHPDLVILYCGNNDASISGALSDSALFAGQRLASLRAALSHSALFRLMRATLASLGGSPHPPDAELQVRVSPGRYGRNLDNIADQCQKRGCPLVIIKPAVPLLWPAGLQFKVFTHLSGADGLLVMPGEMTRLLGRKIKYCLARDRFRKVFGGRDAFASAVYSSAYSDSLGPREAIALYTSEIQSDSVNPLAWNNLGVSFWQDTCFGDADKCLRRARRLYMAQHSHGYSPAALAAGSPFLYNIGMNLLTAEDTSSSGFFSCQALAYQYLDSALQADYYSLRIKKEYLAEIDRLSRRGNLYILDLNKIFTGPNREALFVDHCHPTAEGHRLIAEALAKLIRTQILE